jgi:hypothetical protein
MALSTLLIIIALVMFLIDVVLWNAWPAWRRNLLTPLAGALVCIALLIITNAVHM